MQAKATKLLEAAFMPAGQMARNKEALTDKTAFSQCLADKRQQTTPAVRQRSATATPEQPRQLKRQDGSTRKPGQTSKMDAPEEETPAVEDTQPLAVPIMQPDDRVQVAVMAPTAPVAQPQASVLGSDSSAATARTATILPVNGNFLRDSQTLAAGGLLNSTVNAAIQLAEENEPSVTPVPSTTDGKQPNAPTAMSIAGLVNPLAQQTPALGAGTTTAAIVSPDADEKGPVTAQQAATPVASPLSEGATRRSGDDPLSIAAAEGTQKALGANKPDAPAGELKAAAPSAHRQAAGGVAQPDAPPEQFNGSGQQDAMPKGSGQQEASPSAFNALTVQTPFKTADYGAPPPAQAAVDARDVLRQVADQIHFVRRPGVEEMTMRLKPEALGEVTVKLMLESGQLTARFHADNPEVRQVLENSLQQLKLELSAAGIKVHDVGVYAGLGNPLSQQQGERGQAWADMSGGEKRRLAPEAVAAQMEQQTAVPSAGDELAVDYRV